MPIYEYQCKKCGETTEKIQALSDPPLSRCPACGGRLEKLVSPGAFILKGSGWYATDYAGKGNGKEKAEKEKRRGDSASCPAGAKESPACAGCPKAD